MLCYMTILLNTTFNMNLKSKIQFFTHFNAIFLQIHTLRCFVNRAMTSKSPLTMTLFLHKLQTASTLVVFACFNMMRKYLSNKMRLANVFNSISTVLSSFVSICSIDSPLLSADWSSSISFICCEIGISHGSVLVISIAGSMVRIKSIDILRRLSFKSEWNTIFKH